MTAVAIIQVRMSSMRLPGKVLKPISGKPMIWHIYQRAQQCALVDDVVIATSTECSDDALAEYCKETGLNCFRGSLNNVMGRFLDVRALYPKSTYFVRITGDCPFIDPVFIDQQITALKKHDGDFVWINSPHSVLEGQGVQSWTSLEYIDEQSSTSEDKEHVGSIYRSEHPREFRIVAFVVPQEFQTTGLRLSVDEMDDYIFVNEVYDTLWSGTSIVSLSETLQWLGAHKDIVSTHAHVEESAINKKVYGTLNKWNDIKTVGEWHYENT
ncbi:MAG: NTP transferase domain-containing protein [Fibrobacterales bacterium]